jgi:hypothetical protein
MPLPFVNWWLSLHCSMVVVRESDLTWINSELIHLTLIVFILLPLLNKVLLGGVVAQNLMMFLLVLVLV